MCGINGFTFRNTSVLRKMHRVTSNRGPDDEGFFESDACSLAHNRLSIIDLSVNGRQPMQTPDGRYVITFNGEIYNYKDIRKELIRLGEAFSTETDTEVLLRAWSVWGEESLKKLNGMFSFAIWDTQSRELILIRDQAGIKPLYYFFDGRHLFFSSSIKALLEAGVDKTMDPVAVNLFFRFLYVPAPRTMLSSVRKLPRGHLLRYKSGKIDVREWFRISEREPLSSYADAVNEVRRLTSDSVKSQLVSDRPLGVFLSGGIDSSAILGMLRQQERGKIKTFSVGYEATEQSEKYNADFQLAKQTAEYFGSEHHGISISGKQVAESFETIVQAMDEPVSNHIQPSTYFLAQYAKRHITVALGGDGADELFGGYGRYWLSDRLDTMRNIPSVMRPEWIFHFMGKKALYQKLQTAPGLERFLSFMGQKPDEIRPVFKKGVFEERAARDAFGTYFESIWNDATNQLMAVDFMTWLPDESLIRSDKLTMAHGLEERVPFLDPRLIEMAYSIPSKWKLDRRDLGKRIMREALSEFIPDFILNQEKRGFFSPAAKWLRGDMLSVAREILSPSYIDDEPYIDLETARFMLEDHITKKQYHLNRVWAIMTYRVWRKTILEA